MREKLVFFARLLKICAYLLEDLLPQFIRIAAEIVVVFCA